MINDKYLKITGLFLLIGVGFFLFSCGEKDKSRENVHLSDQVYELVSGYHENGSFDGCILIADLDGIIYKGAFGLSDREDGTKLTTESQFYLASVSKQFTASAILLLIQQGKINGDEEINRYLPGLPDIYENITIRHLLNHTSGIPDYYNFAQLHEGFTNSDVLISLKSVDSLEFEPGTKYSYSNSGYVLLSILVDRISGMRFAEFLYDNALIKAGLDQTVVFDEYTSEPGNRASGYGSEGTLTDYRYRTTGGGGIFSNVEDLYLWHRTLSNSKVINKEIMLQAYQPCILKNDSIVYYGYGWNIDPEEQEHVWHSGELEGFRTWFDRRMDTGQVIILLSNNSSEFLEEIAGKIWGLWQENSGSS
jgi:CubicO group peptidase (beta-lactamase class C family)